jgi:hypothetical protein
MTSNMGYFLKGSNVKGNRLPPRRDNYARPTDNRVEYQMFSQEYFSGADVHLYFGDIYVDEITTLTFQLQEEVMPIYGYNSFTYDAVARGKRLVQGSFGINFTSVGYLQEIITNANAIFYALEEGKNKDIIKPSYYKNMSLSEILEKLGKTSFEQIADEYEKAIWGTVADKDEQYLGYANRPYFRQDQLGFDIRLQYGAVSEATNYVNGKFYQKANEEPPNMTVDVINGVQLTGMAKQGIATETAGAPIQEHYGFIARDFNGVGIAQLARKQKGNNNNNSGQTPDTVYRQMQYGVIR